MDFDNSADFAEAMDKKDPLKHFQRAFIFPPKGKSYLCGNSLGLQPAHCEQYLKQELSLWGEKAVDGHFVKDKGWYHIHRRSKKALAKLTGAQDSEVVAMNSLTVNLHLLMVSFYRPTQTRYKILMEAGAFPSDMYLVESQIRLHGLDPEECIVEVTPKTREHLLHTEAITEAIAREGDGLALVLFSGVQYYTGQFFDLRAITRVGHAVGAKVGFDLAHAVGNVPLQLHEWGADFAAWCSYKYLNSGPGNVAGIFVHERHARDFNLPRMAGWWGHDEGQRFKMEKGFVPMEGADGWQLSNAQVLGLAAHQSALDIFEKAGMQALRQKSLLLTAYLEYLIEQIKGKHPGKLEIISPKAPEERGCQLSLLLHFEQGERVFQQLSEQGVIGDWRNPNVIRLSPVPLYNNFTDVYRAAKALDQAVDQVLPTN